MEALRGVLLDSHQSQSDSWGEAERIASGEGFVTGLEGSGGVAIDADNSSLDMESSYWMREGKEPTHEELMEYLDRHKLQSFLTEVIMHVARHFPSDPFEFLLDHMHSMVMKHRAAQSGAALGASDAKMEPAGLRPTTPAAAPQVTEEDCLRVVQHIAVSLRHEGTSEASAGKLFEAYSSNEKLTSEGFDKMLAHLESSWGLQKADSRLMLESLKRWRFQANAAQGTRGLPLWPLTRSDFVSSFACLLRAVRDRYVPIGNRVHRSLFVKKAAGSITDSYNLGAKLGRGAFGEVRLVTLKDSKEKRVCKRVQRNQQKVSQDELDSEATLLRGMDHPHITQIFEFFEDEEFVDMIMEPVFGGTLTHLVQGLYFSPTGEHLAKRPVELKESWLAVAFAQLLSALAYAHEVAGVIHKDLKTDNILLVGRPDLGAPEALKQPVHVMLADFGIAEVFTPLQILPASTDGGSTPSSQSSAGASSVGKGRSNRVGGTPSYMSPEMFKGSFTEKSDMWSLGVVMFMTMTGVLPYKGDNLLMQAHSVCNPRKHPRWELLSEYSWSLGARWLCQQLLAKDEVSRPGASEASRDPWLVKAGKAHEHVPPTKEERKALQSEHLQSHLMKMARSCVASQLSLSQLHHLNLRFGQYDTSGDGRLGHVEMRQVLEDAGVAADDIDVIIESLDSDGSGVIEYSEFASGCIDLASDGMRDQLRVVFNVFDLDRSGFLSLQELKEVLTEGPNSTALPTRPSSPGYVVRGGATAGVASVLPDGKTVEEVMKEIDTNSGGKVEFEEFRKYLMEEHAKAGQKLHAQGGK
eukprot:TRINITY_DN28655_c0_g1_i1.p1 TRINITY_DN28655_c0_g1~~TRINITY_DN28655_c0_g1_i1.p1  ORF type:complete len:853 (+),score=191.39 TRINITY_DN28655_c0_g1_i1:140-2560(+)